MASSLRGSREVAGRSARLAFPNRLFTLTAVDRALIRERFGSPQVIAAGLLLAFLAQCLWFCAKAPLASDEMMHIAEGRQWHSSETRLLNQSSPVTGIMAAIPLSIAPGNEPQPSWQWLARAPFMLMGLLFGASIWYVARRLYGNIAGYIALTLYAFSPIAIIRAATVQPDVIAEWGAFGIVFTAIGLAHTLYAPREVVLWNWKRIILLGLAIGLGVAAQFSVAVLIPAALGFMWYLAPERRGAATVIMLAGCFLGFVVLFASYGFSLRTLMNGLRASHLAAFYPKAYVTPIAYSRLAFNLIRQPSVLVLLVVALATYAIWKRTRFFGNSAPLMVFAFVLVLGLGMIDRGGRNVYALALPFAYVFIAGVMTDLLESKYAPVAFGTVAGVLLGHVILSISGLVRM